MYRKIGVINVSFRPLCVRPLMRQTSVVDCVMDYELIPSLNIHSAAIIRSSSCWFWTLIHICHSFITNFCSDVTDYLFHQRTLQGSADLRWVLQVVGQLGWWFGSSYSGSMMDHHCVTYFCYAFSLSLVAPLHCPPLISIVDAGFATRLLLAAESFHYCLQALRSPS